jgi:AcrR family transcriptional regulator
MAASPPTLVAVAPSMRSRQREETRLRVLDAAMAEFRRAGVQAAQVEDIVRAAGVARGTFYLHFPTKDHVLLESVCRDQERVAARLTRRLERAPRVFLRGAVDLLIAAGAAEQPAVSREILIAIARHATDIERHRMPVARVTTEYFRRAQQRGEVRRDLTPDELAAAFFPSVLGVLLLEPAGAARRLRARLSLVVDVFVRGIIP